MALVQSLLKECNIPDQVVTPIRLGKFDPTKQVRSRPMKVRLSSPELVSMVLRRFQKVKDKYAGVFITPDRTPQQMGMFKAVKAEMELRVAEGETGLKIKHVGGVPTIVSSGSKN